MIADQAWSGPGGFRTRWSKGPRKKLPVLFVFENGLTAVSPVHHLMDRLGILHSQCARHSVILSTDANGRPEKMSNRYATPFMGSWARVSELLAARPKQPSLKSEN